MEVRLLQSMKFRVPTRFEGRTTFGALASLVSREARKALDYCQEWAACPDRLAGPLLMGRSGTYKTHLLWAVAGALNEMRVRRAKSYANELRASLDRGIENGAIKFMRDFDPSPPGWPTMDMVVTDGAEIAHEVRATVERRNLDAVVSRYRQQGIDRKKAALLVDDVEVMKLSDWLHEELYRIFDYRYQESMPTFIATNLGAEELRRHLGDRIARRIMDLTEPFTL